jgi:hypothetical protein
MSDDFMDITPHGRVLSVFGELKVPAVYCLAELIDNAFDDFWKRPPSDIRPAVTITLPGTNSTLADAEVWAVDNGLGMDRHALNNAVRAGFTSNSRYDALGLFGMGLNIATAGLGWLSEIWTTRQGDPSWTVVTLDLSAISGAENYRVPVRHAPKDDPAEHGTKVIIKRLRQDQFDVLRRQARTIREKLGHIYGHLLSERDYLITVNRTQVRPRRACVWGENRSVSRSGADIPAIIRIDETLPQQLRCGNCGGVRDETEERCRTCNSDRVDYVERRIWGWVGIQRYLHKTDFGIDFLRNGRKILMYDKSVFDWVDPDGLGASEREYPIDSPRNEGRIVGEIHCDHVPVNYTKTQFEFDSPEWKRVLRVIRGESPLRPNRARALGLPVNDSALGRLFTGYRREDPGLNYLVPGDGKVALRDKPIEWAKLFQEGHPDYQTDEKWYEAARLHDNPPAATPPRGPDPGSGSDPGAASRMGLDDDEDNDRSGQPDGAAGGVDRGAPTAASRDECLADYRAAATEVVDMAGRYESDGQGVVELTVWAVRRSTVVDHGGRDVPVFVERTRPPQAEAFVAVDNVLFTEYGVDFRELVLVELAEYVRQRSAGSAGPRPLSAVLEALRTRSGLPKMTPDVLAAQARRLLDRIREAMQPEVTGNPSGYWELLPEGERALTERRFALEGGGDVWEEVVDKGEFALYMPASAVVRLLERRPAAFLDGRVFRRSYATLSDESTRGLVVSRLAGYISDLALLADDHPRLDAEELARSRISCRLVERELADAG